jgi:hypothetical protein
VLRGGLSPTAELALLLLTSPVWVVVAEGITGLPRLVVEVVWLHARRARVRLTLPFCYAPHWGMRPPNHHLILTDERLLVRKNGLGSVLDIATRDVHVIAYSEWDPWYREPSALVYSKRSDGSLQQEGAIAFGAAAARVVRQLSRLGLPVKGL